MNDRDQYFAQQVATASPAMLIAILYDGLVASANRAIDAHGRGERVVARKSLIKAQEIVLELRLSLDHDRGGEIADNLDRLYEFIYQRLVEASTADTTQPANEALQVAQTLRGTWREACLGQSALVPAP